MFPRKFVPMPCGNSGRLGRWVPPEHLFPKIQSLAIHVNLLVEVNVDGAMIRALYRRLDVAVLYPREEPLGDQDIIDLKHQRVSNINEQQLNGIINPRGYHNLLL